MIDIKNIKQKAEEIKQDFWTNDRLPYVDHNLQEFYDNNYMTWIEKAKELRHNYPVETNLFLANIYRSNFIFKLVSDRLSLLKKKPRYTIYDKIRIIKNAFENSYHHFGFITICANYSKEYIDSIHKNWFIPDTAKEFTDDSDLNPWRNKKNDIISGKKWTILNCPLLKFSPVAIDIIQLTRWVN